MQPMEERPVYVRFEFRQVEDRDASIAEGHYVGKDVPFIMVTPPGGNLVHDAPAEEWLDRKRNDKFYSHYLNSFKAWKEGEAEPEIGTSIRSWPVASPANVAACFSANIKTVEDLATAPAGALQKIGMGGTALQQKAQAWLQTASDQGKVSEQVATLTRDNGSLRAQVDELTRQVEAMLAASGAKRPKLTVSKQSEDVQLA